MIARVGQSTPSIVRTAAVWLAFVGCGVDKSQVPAANEATQNLEVVEMVVVLAPGEHGVAGAYFTIINHTSNDQQLVGVTSPAAKQAILHETVEADGVVKMKHADSFRIPAGGRLTLAPGLRHVMLMDLSVPAQTRDAVRLILHFGDGSAIMVDAPVRQLTGRR